MQDFTLGHEKKMSLDKINSFLQNRRSVKRMCKSKDPHVTLRLNILYWANNKSLRLLQVWWCTMYADGMCTEEGQVR